MNRDVCFNALLVNNSSSCISPRISDQSSAIHSDLLHTDINWNNLTAWKFQFISFSIRSSVTGQHDRQGEKLTSLLPNQSEHCPLTGHYFESCEPLVSLTEEKKGITETKWKEFPAKVDHSILKEHFRVFKQLLKLHLPLQWSYLYLKLFVKLEENLFLVFTTSPKFKLRNFLFSWGITAPKHLYLYKFSVQKSSLFCNRGHLNFQAFAWHCI